MTVVRATGIAFATTVSLAFVACEAPPPRIGEPLRGLDEAELARFRAGEALFNRVFSPEEGLGPLFNENQCSACHTDPEAGGTGEQRVVKARLISDLGTCDLLTAEGGENVRSQTTPLLRTHGVVEEAIPEAATQRARFTVPFLFGLGLIEAIPEEAILSRADSSDADGDDVSGRAGRDSDGRLARFSRKAEVATIKAFVESALLFEMGLTTPSRPDEIGPSGRPLPSGTDPAADPEVAEDLVALLTDFVRFLAPPPRRVPDDPDNARLVLEGERLFARVGCTSCHVPTMRAGPSTSAALDRVPVALYSDLLLHDLGAGLANVCGIAALPSELRTAPLMGLGLRERYLHDGRTRNLFDAIRMHGGEAEAARRAFDALGRVRQESVIRFLRSL
ncbi:MAG: di-heme oxidoredictase family protein [Longimicrobiales bacterium]